MLGPKLFLTIAILMHSFACRAHRPVVEVQETPLNSTTRLNSGLAGEKLTSVIVDTLKLPPNPLNYSRISVQLISLDGVANENRNYALKDLIGAEPNQDYTLLVRLYKSSTLVYSNEYCTATLEIRTKAGKNTFTVPVCEIRDLTLPQGEEGAPSEQTLETDTGFKPNTSAE